MSAHARNSCRWICQIVDLYDRQVPCTDINDRRISTRIPKFIESPGSSAELRLPEFLHTTVLPAASYSMHCPTRFSLRATLITLTGVGLTLAVCQARTEQQGAAVAIDRAGGLVDIMRCGPKWVRKAFASKMHLRGGTIGPLDRVTAVILGEPRGLIGVRAVKIGNGDILRVVSSLPYLEELNLAWTITSDEHFAMIGEMPSLKVLDLQGCWITDITLEKCSSFRNLEVLEISNLHISDDGLRHICQLRMLRDLRLRNCKDVTVSGLRYLHRLPCLEVIDISHTGVTAEEVIEFERMLPQSCVVISEHLIRGTSGRQ